MQPDMERVDTTEWPVQYADTLDKQIISQDLKTFGYLFLFLVENVLLFLFQMSTFVERGTLLWSLSQGWEGLVVISMELFRKMQERLKNVPAVKIKPALLLRMDRLGAGIKNKY